MVLFLRFLHSAAKGTKSIILSTKHLLLFDVFILNLKVERSRIYLDFFSPMSLFEHDRTHYLNVSLSYTDATSAVELALID